MADYEGKRILITGGTSGIGLATASLFAAGGARVMVTGRGRPALDRATAALGPSAVGVRSDAASLDDIAGLADRVRSEFGRLDALYLNAGVTRFVPTATTTPADWDEVHAIDVRGPYFTLQTLAPLLVDGAGVVVTTSVTDGRGTPLISAYAAAKAALRSAVRSFATELAPREIRVNAVSPGAVDTGIERRALSAETADTMRASIVEHNPLRRYGRPDEVARAVAFLAFDATYTTGFELVVDGGSTQL